MEIFCLNCNNRNNKIVNQLISKKNNRLQEERLKNLKKYLKLIHNFLKTGWKRKSEMLIMQILY